METRDSEARAAVVCDLSAGLIILLLCFLELFCLGGCASLGQPTGRKVSLPQPIRDLSAEQFGNDVILSFTVPVQTVDRRRLPLTPTIEIYRSVHAAPAPS